METNKYDKIVTQIIHLPMLQFNSDHSWYELVRQTGYYDIDDKLITVDHIKSKINLNEKIIDGWIYWCENRYVENPVFMKFDSCRNKFEIWAYNSRKEEYKNLSKFPDKESCCAHYIKHMIDNTKTSYFKKIKNEKESFLGVAKFKKIKGLWFMKSDQKKDNGQCLLVAKITITLEKIEIKSPLQNVVLISLKKSEISIVLNTKSIAFLSNKNSTNNFNKVLFYTLSPQKIGSSLKKFGWVY